MRVIQLILQDFGPPYDPGRTDGVKDARSLASNLGLHFATIPIAGPFDAATSALSEQFAGVDANTENTILELMDRRCDEGKTVIMVNHDLEILDRFDWVIMLNGTLIAAGPTGETFNERNRQLTYGPTLTEIARAEEIIQKGVAR